MESFYLCTLLSLSALCTGSPERSLKEDDRATNISACSLPNMHVLFGRCVLRFICQPVRCTFIPGNASELSGSINSRWGCRRADPPITSAREQPQALQTLFEGLKTVFAREHVGVPPKYTDTEAGLFFPGMLMPTGQFSTLRNKVVLPILQILPSSTRLRPESHRLQRPPTVSEGF